ncbi:MAG: polyribonucleotide nucleotidyltransferase [Planctomycetes bacterium]|nr:polyribonucleotide nucleotidyltransferase [Planctomycetota bacterium]
MVHTVELELGGRTLKLETGKLARQAAGAVMVYYGETVVLATVLSAPSKRDVDFFPLYVDYREMTYAAGKFPGGFFKREGRPTSKEVLTMRLIDRPIRPMFPDGFENEVQIQCIVMSFDGQNDPDILAMIGSSAALAISNAPFESPIAGVRIGRVDGQLVVNPTQAQLEHSDMDLVVAGNDDGVNMLELGGHEVDETIVAEGIALGEAELYRIIQKIKELVKLAGKPKVFESAGAGEQLKQLVWDKVSDRVRKTKQIPGKADRNTAMAKLRDELIAELCPQGEQQCEFTAKNVAEAFNRAEKKIHRELILSGIRPDGRGPNEIRPLSIEVSVLPRTHGSALFSRGETMTMTTATLGTGSDEQSIDGLGEEYSKKFMLHYNFPPFSVGEIRPIRGPGRREIGHGALAEKSIEAVLPSSDDFPYTIRLVSEILESNGSSSMATVCGGTLALMDAGVPITRPVAGISIGRVAEGEQEVLLTDIIGEEDYHGDMDFKVAGTIKGITGIQLDMKARAIKHDTIVKTLAMAREARLIILEHITKVIDKPRDHISEHAPRLLSLKIDPEKIGKLIGPGGKMIRSITEATGVKIDVEDDGTVYIASVDAAAAERARAMIEALTDEVKVGRIYHGKVVSVKDFGAFIEIAPGQDGLCHISELADSYVKNVASVCKIGDEMDVKVIAVDEHGRVKLSRKAAIKETDPSSCLAAASEPIITDSVAYGDQ